MNSLVNTLFSNQAVLDNRKTKWPLTLLMFLISVMLIATPFALGRFLETPSDILVQFEGVTQPMMKVLTDFDCMVTDQKLRCDQPYARFEEGGYVVEFMAKEYQDIVALGLKYIVIMEQSIAFGYNGNELQGNYSFLESVSFDSLLEMKTEESIDENTLVAHFLQNISHSNIATKVPMIYVTMFMMYIMYTLMIAAIFMLINGKRLEQPFTYQEVVTIVVLSMFTPALVCAIWGLFSPEIASALCPLFIMIRLMMVYYKMLKVR